MLAGSALGLLVVPRAPSPEATPDPAPPVSFLGQKLELGDEALKIANQRAEDLSGRLFSVVLPRLGPVTLPLSRWGLETDLERLKLLVRDADDASSPMRKLWKAKEEQKSDDQKSPERSLPAPLVLNPEIALPELIRLKDRFDRRPENARLDIEAKTIHPEIIGEWVDIDATLIAIEQAVRQGKFRVDAVVRSKAPERTKKRLEGLQFDHVLGHFETRYSRSRKAADRTFNLALAAQKLDGTVLLPGEEFDFNEIVGARDEANGYKVATVIADGELVDGIGGGTCQISGTLHGAAFFAGLEILERYPHTRPSSYIKMGMDATVVYPTINFRFRNPFDFPIAIHQTVKDGAVRAEILGPEHDQVVTLIRRVDDAIPYEQLERKDSRLPRGTRILAQRGIPGFRLHRYRTIRDGSHTLREKWRDVYPPTAQVIRIGTGEASLPKKHSVGTPEYKADELLILTLRRSEPGQPGEFAENREAGQFGQDEWTRKAGMPFWSGD